MGDGTSIPLSTPRDEGEMELEGVNHAEEVVKSMEERRQAFLNGRGHATERLDFGDMGASPAAQLLRQCLDKV